MALSVLTSSIFRDAATALIRTGLGQNAVARVLRGDPYLYSFANTAFRDTFRAIKSTLSFTDAISELDPRKIIPRSYFRPAADKHVTKYLYLTEISFIDPDTETVRTRRIGLRSDTLLSQQQVFSKTQEMLAEKWGQSAHYQRALDSLNVERIIDVFEFSAALSKQKERK